MFKKLVFVLIFLSACTFRTPTVGDTGLDTRQILTGFAWAHDGNSFAFSYQNQFLKRNETGVLEPHFREYLYLVSRNNPVPELVYENQDEDLNFRLIDWHLDKYGLILGGDDLLFFNLKNKTLEPLSVDSSLGQHFCYATAQNFMVFAETEIFYSIDFQQRRVLSLPSRFQAAHIRGGRCDPNSNMFYFSVLGGLEDFSGRRDFISHIDFKGNKIDFIQEITEFSVNDGEKYSKKMLFLGFSKEGFPLYAFPQEGLSKRIDEKNESSSQPIYKRVNGEKQALEIKASGLDFPYALSPNKKELLYHKPGTGVLSLNLETGKETVFFQADILPEGEGLPF